MGWKQLSITKRLYILSAISLFAPLIASTGMASADGITPGNCSSIQIQVALASGDPANQTISGTLCKPLWWSSQNHEVDVLVHGATYNSSYWNWPINTNQYSYVDETLLAGRATLAYDSLGAGNSSHPLSSDISIDTEAFVLHQVLNWAHSQNSFSKYVVVGHSLGSIVAVDESSSYHDEQALVLTGYSHSVSPVGEATAIADLYPANLDPQFAGKNLDSGYLTTVPGTRKTLFYGTTAAPSIIAYDEAHKDVVPGMAFGEGIGQTVAPAAGNIANGVTVPVLEVLGQQDSIFCGTGAPAGCSSSSAVRSFDLPYFSGSPSLSVDIIPLTGHDIALHPTNPISFLEINGWLATH